MIYISYLDADLLYLKAQDNGDTMGMILAKAYVDWYCVPIQRFKKSRELKYGHFESFCASLRALRVRNFLTSNSNNNNNNRQQQQQMKHGAKPQTQIATLLGHVISS